MRTINTPFDRAQKRAFDLCQRTHETYYVTHDSLDAPGEYHVVSEEDIGSLEHVRFSARWTGSAVHGTRG